MSSIRLFQFLLVFVAAGCSPPEFPWLDTLDDADGVKASGLQLIALAQGATRVDRDEGENARAFVAVHGYASEGYEWVYPLKELDSPDDSVYLYRWDWQQCPETAARDLARALESLFASGIAEVVLIGHSYGGTVVTALAAQWAGKAIDVHAIAAPLRTRGTMGDRCKAVDFSTLAGNVTFTQWRTRHELDGAFKDMEHDPQTVDIAGARVVLLPKTYRDRRLGHNWSISWVADHLDR